MGGFVVGEVDALPVALDGTPLPVADGDAAPVTAQALLAAGVERLDDGDVVRLLALGKDGGLRLSSDTDGRDQAILIALNSIAETLTEIREILAGLGEE